MIGAVVITIASVVVITIVHMIGVVVITMRVQYDRCSCNHNASAI